MNRLYIEEGSKIDREFYLSCLVDRATSRVAFVASREGGMDIEEVAARDARKDHHRSRSIRRPASCRITAAAVATGSTSRATSPSKASAGRDALPRLRRQGHEPARDQSAGRHQGRQRHLPRRQDRFRRQRALSPPRHRRAARRERGRRQGDRGVEVRPQLRRARRHHRLHGQRRRARHGDDGHHQALRRGAGELPRCRRRRHQGEGGGRVQDHHLPTRR